MVAELILAWGLCISGDSFIQNSDIVSVASRRSAHDQVDGRCGVYKILSYSRQNSYLTFKNLDPKVITEGRLCTAQAVLKQIGADGVALSYVLHGIILPCSVFLTVEASIAGPWCALFPSIGHFSYGTYRLLRCTHFACLCSVGTYQNISRSW